jgi:hypothetical protein
MMTGDILKYLPTSTVGKVTDVRERDGRVWVRLDRTKLYYDQRFLTPADASEYKEVSFKELERSSAGDRKSARAFIEDLHEVEEEVDIRDLTPSGGG